MANYHCPYCSPRYQVHIKSSQGQMICAHCGEELVRIPVVKPIQVFAFMVVFAFISPLLFLVADFVMNYTERETPKHLQQVSFIKTLLAI